MRILAIGGDVGGARAVQAACEYFQQCGDDLIILDHRFLGAESPRDWKRVSAPDFKENLPAAVRKISPDAVIFATSVKDKLALDIARAARELSVLTVCLIDNWGGYKRRVEIERGVFFWPDLYLVPDQLAYAGAEKDGISKAILHGVGQPALNYLERILDQNGKVGREEWFLREGFYPNKKLIIFVSEPAEDDQGDASETTYRGYTEKTVLRDLCDYLQPYSEELQIGVYPHPREDVVRLKAVWENCRGRLDGHVSGRINGQDALCFADGVSGMASLVLYQAWLIGKPVLSLQPGLRDLTLDFFSQRDGIFCVFDDVHWDDQCLRWLRAVRSYDGRLNVRKELEDHFHAGKNIREIILSSLASRKAS